MLVPTYLLGGSSKVGGFDNAVPVFCQVAPYMKHEDPFSSFVDPYLIPEPILQHHAST